jgi:hypothetical protein
MTHEAQSFLFADISSPFLLTELDGDEALVRPQACSKPTLGTRLKPRWSQRSKTGTGVSQEERGGRLAVLRFSRGGRGARCAFRAMGARSRHPRDLPRRSGRRPVRPRYRSWSGPLMSWRSRSRFEPPAASRARTGTDASGGHGYRTGCALGVFKVDGMPLARRALVSVLVAASLAGLSASAAGAAEVRLDRVGFGKYGGPAPGYSERLVVRAPAGEANRLTVARGAAGEFQVADVGSTLRAGPGCTPWGRNRSTVLRALPF